MTIPPRQPTRKDGPYSYDKETISALRAGISGDRFATYLALASDDDSRALQLYARNVALGAAFHGPLQALEVTLRNAVHSRMTQVYGNSWFDSAPLDAPEQKAINKAKGSLDFGRKQPTPGRVIAATNLGFWVALFARKYDATLWRTALHECFDTSQSRANVHDSLNRLRTLRNRIVHHEPILQRDLRADHRWILNLLRRLSPETAAWVAHHSRVREILGLSSRRMQRF